MKAGLPLAALVVAFGVCAAPAAFAQQPAYSVGHVDGLFLTRFVPRSETRLAVTSPAFKEGGDIPFENTQYRGNIFPGLNWSAGPPGTRSYLVIMQGEGPTGPGSGTSVHFTLFNIPDGVRRLEPGLEAPPAGSVYGPNVHGLNQPYAGPHTHDAIKHLYHLQVFALDTVLDLPATASLDEIARAMSGHVLASGVTAGLATKDPAAPPEPR